LAIPLLVDLITIFHCLSRVIMIGDDALGDQTVGFIDILYESGIRLIILLSRSWGLTFGYIIISVLFLAP
jgi:hypothetical protein